MGDGKPIDVAAIEARMLSGEMFTYGGLVAQFSTGAPGCATDRAVDRMIQKLRKKGLVAIIGRHRQSPVWCATAAGQTHSGENGNG